MKKIKNNAHLFLFAFAAIVLLAFVNFAEKKSISIEKAINEGITSAKIISKGGYSGDCITIKIENLSSKDTLIRIEPGRRLVSIDSTIQDILIIKELLLQLKGGETIYADIFGFCCQSSNGGPYSKAKYNVGFMEDSTMIELAEFFNVHIYPNSVMQSAVWCLSNDHSINSINGSEVDDKLKMAKLYRLLAKAKGIEYTYPWYAYSYVQDTSVVFTNEPEILFGEIEYTLDHQSSVDINIRDENNFLVGSIMTEQPQDRNKYTYKFKYNVRSLKKGKYFLRVYADNQLKLEKVFKK